MSGDQASLRNADVEFLWVLLGLNNRLLIEIHGWTVLASFESTWLQVHDDTNVVAVESNDRTCFACLSKGRFLGRPGRRRL